MIEAIEGFRLPRYAQIPNVGLHLEQVVRYVNKMCIRDSRHRGIAAVPFERQGS